MSDVRLRDFILRSGAGDRRPALPAARRRVLEEPARHLPLLRRTAVIGVTVGRLGGLSTALAHVGALDVPDAMQSESGALTLLRDATGIAAGLGYVAVVALFVHWWTGRAPKDQGAETRGAQGRGGSRTVLAVSAVSAVGKRSLSCYLAHSLVFAPLPAVWGLGLGEHLTSATMALFAVGVRLLTVVGAYAKERAGRRGPAEALLRRLIHR